MKKSLVALAALAAVGVASAQSSVTLFGTLDLGAGQTTKTTSDASAVTSAKTKATNFGGINSGNATNAIGIRGTEDLGGGLTAGFVYAWSLNPSNVANNGTVADITKGNGGPFGQVREANVSLSSKTLGTVVIGTQNTTAFAWPSNPATIQNADVGGSFYGTLNNTSGTGRVAVGMLASTSTGVATPPAGLAYATPAQAVTGQHARYENMISYITPTFSGLSAGISFVATNSTVDNSVATDTESKLGAYILRADYAAGKVRANYAYTNKRLDTALAGAGGDNTVKHHLLNVAYDLGVATPWVMYTNGKNNYETVSGVASTGNLKATGYEIGVRIPVGAFTPYALIARGDLTATGNLGTSLTAGKVEVDAYQVGVKYSMSRRTTLFGAYGQSEMKVTSGANNGDKDTIKGYRVGVTHTF